MSGYVRQKNYEAALRLFEEVLCSSCEVDGAIYAAAMNAAYESAQYSMVHKIALQSKRTKITLTESAYTVLIQALGQLGGYYYQEIVSTLEDMRKEGLKPNVITYTAAITACKNFPHMVKAIYQDMIKDEIVPNIISYTAILDSYARAGGSFAGKPIITIFFNCFAIIFIVILCYVMLFYVVLCCFIYTNHR